MAVEREALSKFFQTAAAIAAVASSNAAAIAAVASSNAAAIAEASSSTTSDAEVAVQELASFKHRQTMVAEAAFVTFATSAEAEADTNLAEACVASSLAPDTAESS